MQPIHLFWNISEHAHNWLDALASLNSSHEFNSSIREKQTNQTKHNWIIKMPITDDDSGLWRFDQFFGFKFEMSNRDWRFDATTTTTTKCRI